MEKFFKRLKHVEPSSSSSTSTPTPMEDASSSKVHCGSESDLPELEFDPGLRRPITSFHPNIRERVRRAYLINGPCQPRNIDFPRTMKGNGVQRQLRRFCASWYNGNENWLEYSKDKDKLFCLCCYLFKSDIGDQAGGDAFVESEYDNWKKKERLRAHVGDDVNSVHNRASAKSLAIMDRKQHIEPIFERRTTQDNINYRIRLVASIDCVRFLLTQGLPFRGHDESEISSNRGNFLELLSFLGNQNEVARTVILKNAPENHKMIAPSIQKDIVNASSMETTKAIIKELDDGLFAILVDESRDMSYKEQMALVLRYVDARGCVVERFLGIKHVSSTTALALKSSIDGMFATHELSIDRVRGQGYDGASNMQGEFNGLKALILKENQSAFYVHCFAHQLQLALIAVAKNCPYIDAFFELVTQVVNLVGGSCKRHDYLRDNQFAKVAEALAKNEIDSGQGLNQERTLKRPSDTRWGSHYGTLVSLSIMFSSVIDLLGFVVEESTDKKGEACNQLMLLQSFSFVSNLHLMKLVLGITNDLSLALQRKDQDIVNAMRQVKLSKERLQETRENGWNTLIGEVSSFCLKHGIEIPNMKSSYKAYGRPRRRVEEVTNEHHYKVEIFNSIIDRQLQELNNRFDEVNTELLLCVACLNPSHHFEAFNKERVIRFAEFYPKDFSPSELSFLSFQLDNYIKDVRGSDDFLNLNGIGDLARKMVATKRHVVYSWVYKLVKLALILPVATATVERAFSGMKIVKNRLRNRMGDQWLNDSLVVYVEEDIFNGIYPMMILWSDFKIWVTVVVVFE